MKFPYTCYVLIIFMSGINNRYIGETTPIKKIEEDNVVLRKLLQSVQTDVKEDSKAWNDVLAKVFVDSIKSVFSSNNESREKITDSSENGYFTKWISKSLLFFKNIFYGTSTTNDVKPTNPTKPTTQLETLGENYNRADSKEVTDTDVINTNDDVEVFEPKYHGKRCAGCNETSDSNCPEGLVKDNNGECVLKVDEKLIIAIPGQCPKGYRRDKLNYCRLQFG
ncbi:uncharacterized protein LOC131852061 [Achroia grisella]|uniref:uncharacterized protein LOC131852061 n=1 Tax=Achroia grisella TaxID=688607 RepID=UPI0027D2A6F0|nr:uncharacterized protein LOC131852061 [Achroia grisella]